MQDDDARHLGEAGMKKQFQPHVRMSHYTRVRIRGATHPDKIREWIAARYGAQALWRGDDQAIVFQVDMVLGDDDERIHPEDVFWEIAKNAWKLNGGYCPIEFEAYLVMNKSVHQFESEPQDTSGAVPLAVEVGDALLGPVGSLVVGAAKALLGRKKRSKKA